MERRSASFWNRSRLFLNRAERIRASRSPVRPLPPRNIYGNFPFKPRAIAQKRRPKLHEIIIAHLPDWDLSIVWEYLRYYLPTREQLKIPYMIMAALPIAVLCVALLFFFPQDGAKAVSGKVIAPVDAGDPIAQADRIAGNIKSKGRTDIVIFGSDLRESDGAYRTDVVMLVSIDLETNQVSVVSFPRDLWIDVPGRYGMKINSIMGVGGFKAVRSAFEKNFNVKPRFYVMTNFQGIIHIIDSLDDIEVEIQEPLTDRCDLPQAVNGDCSVEPGMVKMNGETALWYVRSRETSSDYDRLRRTQEVGYAIFKKMISCDAIARLPELYSAYGDSFETNMRVNDIIPLLPVAARAYKDRDLIRTAAIGEGQATPTWSWDGMWILLPDLSAVKGVLRETGIQ
jgi:polyisoprenyl-teichoic acid--peptidoglycan teichoic acid transferase